MWKIYSVKTLYRTKALGKPKAMDSDYRKDLDMIEERIVTVKARTFDEAIYKGEREAILYAKDTCYLNPYGQNIIQKYIGSIDVFEIFEEVKASIEVFSTTYLVNKSVSNKEITNNILGEEFKKERNLRKKFLNSEFNGVVK